MSSRATESQLAYFGAQVASYAPQTATVGAADPLADAVTQWKRLQQSSSLGFSTYASFLLSHPGWPGELAMRRMAENALLTEAASPSTVVAYFRRFEPLTQAGRVRYALALQATGSSEALPVARQTWTKGVLSVNDEATMLGAFGTAFRTTDHDQRMNMLLMQGATGSAARILPYTSPDKRGYFAARLALRSGAADALSQAAPYEASAAGDPGYLADKATWFAKNAALGSARDLLARPHQFATAPADPEAWLALLSVQAKGAAADGQSAIAYGIAHQVDDAYPAGTDIGAQSYAERDAYTDLVWLAGQTAMKRLGRPADAVGMFEHYARASRTPTVQSKGYYWAARAAEAAGQADLARADLERAAGFRDQFYGQLATERLGRSLSAPPPIDGSTVDAATRSAFYRREVVRAAQLLGTLGNWQDQTAFVRQIALDATSQSDHLLAAELSRTLGRPDLGVMVGRSALQNGLTDYSAAGFPIVRVPDQDMGSWTMIHAIARQESQFDRMAVSRAGARGLMQLMPGTARETAAKLGLDYEAGAMHDSDFSIHVGSAYFQRLYAQYGSYPLAIAAYNAGPGNVNKWLAANGDPRTGAVQWVDWIEAIPIHETKNYVQRVLENAVVYDLMNPQHSTSRGTANLSWYLGNKRPG